MLRRQVFLSALAAGAFFGMVGCKHRCCRNDGLSPAPSPFLPAGPGATIPPPGVPITPNNTGSLPPPAFTPNTSNRPAPEILIGDPIAPGGTSSQKKNSNDGILGSPANTANAAKPLAGTLEPPVAAKPKTAGNNPAATGLVGFTSIKDGVATGRKPTLDGFDTLKKDGYKTVIYLHAPGADVTAVRDLAETRGLKFVAVETTPENLADAFDQLNKATAEKTALPAYVFDEDGSRISAVWYLHFKTVDLESADVSKIRAKALGLADDSEFWPAIKKYMDR